MRRVRSQPLLSCHHQTYYKYILSLGNVYIADYANQRIRKVTVSTGIITTVAGTGTSSYSGDGGQATAATLNYPQGFSLDLAGRQSYLDFRFFLLLFTST